MDTPSNYILCITNLRKADHLRYLQRLAVPAGMVQEREQQELRWYQELGKVVHPGRQPERQRDLYGPPSRRGHH